MSRGGASAGRWWGSAAPAVVLAVGMMVPTTASEGREDFPPQAQALLDSEEWAAAAEALEAWLAEHPAAAVAWRGLGTARLRQGQLDGALEAFEKARELGLTEIPLGVQAALAAAGLGRHDQGMEWLERALADGLPLPVLATAPVLEPLRDAMRGHPPFDVLLAEANLQVHPCRHDERYRQLEFWIGEWEVEASGAVAGTNRIESILDGCVILEQWRGSGGLEGRSFNFYDAASEEWRQLWVDASGTSIDYRGGFEGDVLHLQGTQVRADGSVWLSRMRLTPRSDGSVRQLIERSSDGGHTWNVGFDGQYRRREP